MKYITLLCLYVIFNVTNIFAQKGASVIDSIAIKETFSKQYPNAEQVDYKYWGAVYFQQGGDIWMAHYSRKGKWKETHQMITYRRLPEAIKNSFNKYKKGNKKAKSVYIVYRPSKESIYSITLPSRLHHKSVSFYGSGKKVPFSYYL